MDSGFRDPQQIVPRGERLQLSTEGTKWFTGVRLYAELTIRNGALFFRLITLQAEVILGSFLDTALASEAASSRNIARCKIAPSGLSRLAVCYRPGPLERKGESDG